MAAKKKPAPSDVKVSTDGTLTAELLTELEAEKSEVVKAMVSLKDFPIETREDLELAAGLVNDVVEKRKRVDERLRAITKPMREAEASVRELFRPVQTAIAEVEEWLKRHIAEAQANIDAKNRELMAATEIAMQSGLTEAATTLASSIQSTATPAGVQIREHWSFEIVDHDLVPREYLKVNEAALRAAVQATKGSTNIPGVRAIMTPIVAAGGRAKTIS